MPSQLKEKNLYRDIFRGAWEITWHRRELWILGFFAALLGFNGGAFEYISRAAGKMASGTPFVGGAAYVRLVLDKIVNGAPLEQLSIVLTLLLAAIVTVFCAVIGVAAVGALLFAAAQRASRKKILLRDALAAGMSKIAPLLAVQIFGRAAMFVIFTLAAIGLYASWTGGLGTALYFLLFLLFAAAALVISFIMTMTSAGIMIRNARWHRALADAWTLLRRHWLVSIEMMALLFLTTVVLIIAVSAAGIIVMILFTLIAFAGAAVKLGALLYILNSLFMIVIILMIAVAGSALATFEYSAWSLLYVRLSDRGALAKLERLFERVRSLKRHVRFKR